MPDIQIIRGDSYALRRPLYTYTFVDEDGGPLNLAGCTIRSTFKTQITPVDTDPNDDFAIIKHQIVIDLNGVEQTNVGMFLHGPATAGVIHDRFTSVETKLFVPEQRFISDVQLTDARGEVFTWMFEDGVTAIDSVTNRDE